MSFAGVVAIARVAQFLGVRYDLAGLVDLGDATVLVAALTLWVVVAWYRDEDALAAGVLIAISLGGAALLTTALLTTIATAQIANGLTVLLLGYVVVLVEVVLLVPVCASAVWLARYVSNTATRLFDRVP